MRIRLANLWDELQSSYWFTPAVMTVAAIVLSFVTIAIDGRVQQKWVQTVGFLWAGSPEGARSLLSAVSGSTITVASVVFSITFVALSLASSQFGPHVLREFMRSKTNQLVLGLFVSTFIYSLLVLRTIRSGDSGQFVPYISVTFSLVLVLMSLGVLIYFIHHVALSMQAPYVIAAVARELMGTIERLFPAGIGQNRTEVDGVGNLPEDNGEIRAEIKAGRDGYVQAVDVEKVMRLATEHDLLLRLRHRPGHFVTRRDTLFDVWPGDRLNDELGEQLKSLLIIGRQRTQTQDIEFAIDQLVQIAVRALSPGVNDPFTAMSCIDWLSAAVSRLARCQFPGGRRYDDDGRLRVVVERPETFEGVVNASFNQIRQNAHTSVAVTIRLLEALADIIQHARSAETRAVLRRQADLIINQPMREDLDDADREDIEQRYQVVLDRMAEAEKLEREMD